MKITADSRIPLIKALCGDSLPIELLASENICQENLQKTDVLLVRSVTSINQTLLEHTPVRFVGSVTAGINHLDTEWLNNAGIQWCYAAGCNANPVCEYVLACLTTLMRKGRLSTTKPRIAVIGAGYIGNLVIQQLLSLGFEVFYHDPFKISLGSLTSTDLEQLNNMDAVSIHVPLIKNSAHSTYHLINDAFLKRQKPNCILINTSRGEVVDETALLKMENLQLCLDVWENEPNISIELFKKCFIATPHIAGYSEESKLRATLLIYQQLRELQPQLQLPPITNIEELIQQFLPPLQSQLSYDPLIDTEYLKKYLFADNSDSVATRFKNARNHYILRRESQAALMSN